MVTGELARGWKDGAQEVSVEERKRGMDGARAESGVKRRDEAK